MIRAALLAVCLAPLAACGFTPVYGGQGAAFQNAGPITIPEIQGRTGHYLRNELAREIGQGVPGFPAGSLEIDLSSGVERLAFAPDQAASRPASRALQALIHTLSTLMQPESSGRYRSRQPAWTCSELVYLSRTGAQICRKRIDARCRRN